ncbi:hypothetical protein V6Z05_11525 [Leptospira venezuelensis]|uniref:hypothetical protein n=1 Tax=Leptospira venezuelensis TaxID=1958811 RepID=UPI000A364B8C|nr:hypothetical protein [Leptospira venezuelensis]
MDILFESQKSLNPPEILEYAKKRNWIAHGIEELSLRQVSRAIANELLKSKHPLIQKVKNDPDRISLSKSGKSALKITRSLSSFANPPHKEERNLHAIFAEYAKSKLYIENLYTIHHERSTKERSGKQKWSHPDMVGALPLDSIQGKRSKKQSYRIYSFELKINLKFNNIKESFAQSFFNSSWAHEGYLVASDIDREEEFFSELQLLHSVFGIGVIALNRFDPHKSEILILSEQRRELNQIWIGKIASKNQEFAHFIQKFYP